MRARPDCRRGLMMRRREPCLPLYWSAVSQNYKHARPEKPVLLRAFIGAGAYSVNRDLCGLARDPGIPGIDLKALG